MKTPTQLRSRRRSGVPAPIAGLASPAAYPLGTPDTTRPPWPGEEISVGKARIFRRRTPATGPDPEPALYVHGLGGASTNFTDMAALLTPWFDAEAIDLPGFGHSGPSPERNYSIAAHARLVIRYLEQSGRGAVHLVGNSMGGAISIQVAATRPDLVRTLTLVSPAVPDLRPHKGSDLMLPLLLLPGVGPRAVGQLDNHPPERRARALINLCFAHPELVPANRIAEAAADITDRRQYPWASEALLRSFRGLVRSYLSPGARSAWRMMAEIAAPTVVIWGELDRLVDVSNAPRVAATIPDATLLVLPDVGHTAQLEDPITTARAILALRERGRNTSPK
jgi:pimeloyl-ACP methyl ester carboxylesterase